MNYEYFKIFYYVGKHKNITRAAVELYSSQPAVTRAVQNLENELGCRLFVRTKNGVEFTHEGQTLFDYVSIAHSQILKGENEISHSISAENGTVYIGATVTALYGFLFGVLDEFHKNHPNVKFKINTGSSNGTIEKLKNGIFDIAFVSTPCNNTKSLSLFNVRSFNDILIAGNNFKELEGKTLSLGDIKNYPFVSLRHSMQLRQFLDDIFAGDGVALSPDIEADSADLLVPMISHNFGLGFVPQDMAEEAIKRGQVFKVNFETELPQRYICMVTDPHHPQTNVSREFSKLITRSVNIN